jgi:anti-anti-sigma factor
MEQGVTMVEFNFDAATQTLFCRFKGRMDTVNADLATQQVNAKLNESQGIAAASRIVFDLGAVDYVASSFLRLCIFAAKNVPKGNFSIINTNPQVLKVFTITGLAPVLHVT